MFFVTLLIALLSVNEDFDNLLIMRDFDGAIQEAAQSDSMQAVVFQNVNNHAMASMLFQRAFEKEPSAGLFCDLWRVVAVSTEFYNSLSTVSFKNALSEWGPAFTWQRSELASLVETSMIMNDSLLTDSLLLVLTNLYPGSLEASEIIGWQFFDRIYPVWYDDSARVVVLAEFLDQWGDKSELWRSRAWQYTLAAAVETADSLEWKDYFHQWRQNCPEDPQVYLTGAAFFIDRDSSWTEALQMAEIGLEIVENGWSTLEIPPEEWMLTERALETGLQFRRLFAMAGLGDNQQALEELQQVILNTEFDIDDYHTKASLFWLEGKLYLAAGDTLNALSSFTESAIVGEVKDRWSGLSITSMDSLLPSDITPLEWARNHTGYIGPVFSNTTELLGPDSLVSGSRVSWCDWNSDGLPDLFIGNSLFQNINGSSFTDITSEVGLDLCNGNGGIWGDLTGDGFPDLVTSGNPVQLFVNNNGIMKDVTEGMGISATDGSVEGVALLDWNADGWLDLYLASYEGGRGSGTDDAFYLGSEDGFVVADQSLGMIPFLEQPLCGRGVSPCDFDLDGDVDVFVSNYRLQENFLWENEEGSAVNTALNRGIAGVDVFGWWGHTIGSAWGDYDNDGDWDLFSANLAHPRYIGFSDRSMLLNNTENNFSDVRAQAGIKFEETHSNPLWGDFNNDGLLDLFITSIYPDRRTYLYQNMGNGLFEDVTWLSGARVFNGWGAAAADYNLDGRLDLVIGSGDGPSMLQNNTETGNWILVEIGSLENLNPSGLGAIVRIKQGEDILLRQVEGGSGTTSQNSSLLHFGLSSENEIVIEVIIPGSVSVVETQTAIPGEIVRFGN